MLPAGFKRRLGMWPWLAPAFLVLAFIFAYSLINLVSMAVSYHGEFIGTRNLSLTLKDPTFRTALYHNARLLLVVPVVVSIAFTVAVFIHGITRAWKLHRTAIFLPYILPIPVVGVIFGQILLLHGPLNQTLESLGLGFLAFDWLGSPSVALWSLALVILWKEVGFGVVLFIARMMSVPEELYEAARLDGARGWRLHWNVTFPQLKSVIIFFAVNEAITMLAWVFSYVYVISNGTGGPGDATQVAELYIYQTAFQFDANEIAAASALILFVVTLILILLIFRFQQVATRRRRADA